MSELRNGYALATKDNLTPVMDALRGFARGQQVKCVSGEHGGRTIVGTLTITPGQRDSHLVVLHPSSGPKYPLCRLTPDSTTAFQLEANRVHVAICYIGGWVYYEFTLV